MTIRIERATSASPDVLLLIEELEGELSAHYAAKQRHGLSLDELFQKHIHFFVAYREGKPAGCGGVALYSDFGELKRFYVRPAVRGRGIAELLLAQIKAVAIASGLRLLRLETGDKQHAALRFYDRCGFRGCVAFEPYASMQPDTISTSIFMEAEISFSTRCA